MNKKEIRRLVRAFGYSFDGLKVACRQPAFRIELLVAIVMVPLACYVTKGGVERAMLISSIVLVMLVELLNSAVEAAVDRISTDWHPLSKHAKDFGSAAVLLSLINAGLVWVVVIAGKL